VVSIVMAIFFQSVAGSRWACRHPFYRRPAASMVSAGFGASTWRRRAPDTAAWTI